MNTILAVKLNRQRLVVCLEDSILIHNISDLKMIHTIKHIPLNPQGLIALSPSNDPCYLAYPAKNTTGEVNIFDAFKLENKLTIAAHDNPLVSMTFDSQGTKLATASDKVNALTQFYSLVLMTILSIRGLLYAFLILSRAVVFTSFAVDTLAASQSTPYPSVLTRSFSALPATLKLFIFLSSPKSKFAAMTHCTLITMFHSHCFSTSKPQEDDLSDMFMGAVKKVFQSASSIGLTSVGDMMNQWRSFATVRLPFSGPKSVCAITTPTSANRAPHVLVASTDGYLYVYDLNVVDGGDCTLIRQHW